MHPDFKELLSAFNAEQVRYLIVGGYAVSFHAQPRATKDLDILIAADAKNSKAVYAALAKFGAPTWWPQSCRRAGRRFSLMSRYCVKAVRSMRSK